MKSFNRLLGAVLATVVLLSAMLTGCSLWKPTLAGPGDVAVTYGDGQTISTGEYLAYLYLNFESVYSYYAQYGMDPFTQTFPYGEGETPEKLSFEDYVVRVTADTIRQQIALEKVMKDNGLSYIEDEEKELDESLATMEQDAYLSLGINNEHYISAYKKVNLAQRGAFFGLYGKEGTEAVADKELRAYFDENYLSYKIISVSLTDSEGAELDKDKKEAELKKLEGYLKICNEKGFEKAMDAYNKDTAEEGTEVEATKDEDNRINADATSMDENLVKAIRGVKLGKAKVVEYKASGTTPTAALIMRLDTNKPKSLYTDEYENILTALKMDAFTERMDKVEEGITVTFDEDVLAACTPADFIEKLNLG